jgi:hypothetical protein
MLFLCCTTSLLPSAKEAANEGTCMLLLLLTVVLTPPLFAAMVLAGLALLDLQKRDATPFLAPALVSSGGKNRHMPAGLWHVYCLAATYHDSSCSSEG